jgi:hypothetical protein
MAEFNERFNRLGGGSKQAYDYLLGKGDYPTTPYTPTGELQKPYFESAGRFPTDIKTKRYLFQDGKYVENPDYVPPVYTQGAKSTGLSTNEVIKGFKALKPAETQANFDYVSYLKANPEVQSELDQGIANFGTKADPAAAAYNHYIKYGKGEGRPFTMTPNATPDDAAVFEWANTNNVSDAQLAEQMGISVAEVARRRKAFKDATTDKTVVDELTGQGGDAYLAPPPGEEDPDVFSDPVTEARNGGMVRRMALGGLGALARGGVAELPDGAFVLPARITSELGNGSTNAGAQKLHAMEQRLLGKNAQPVNLGRYSGGGNLVRGAGDGVSDSVPATIGGRQPALIADGEYIFSQAATKELGKGSIEAGARKLYAMMDRVQKARGKTTGKKRVATNTHADKYLPA